MNHWEGTGLWLTIQNKKTGYLRGGPGKFFETAPFRSLENALLQKVLSLIDECDRYLINEEYDR